MQFTAEIPLCLRKGADECLVKPPTDFSRCVAILELVGMFRDRAGTIWVNLPRDIPGSRVVPLRSRQLRDFLAEAFDHFLHRRPKDHAVTRAIREHEIRSKYGHDCPIYGVHRRIQFHDVATSATYSDNQSVLIDLADRHEQAVEITAASAELIDGAGHHWLRAPHNESLPVPKPAKSIGKLLRRLRYLLKPASDADFHRILVWLFTTLNPNGPRPVLILDGPRAATSNTARFLRSVLDPATIWRNDFPTTDAQLRKLVTDNYIPVFAGLQRLSPKRAETLCRLAHDYRRSAIVVLHRSRPDRPAVTDPELQRSSITVHLSGETPPIEELKLRHHLDLSLPEMLSLMVHATHHALGHFRQARPPRVPYFPDSARWVTAAADILHLTREQIGAAFTPVEETEGTGETDEIAVTAETGENPSPQPQQTTTTFRSKQIPSNPPAPRLSLPLPPPQPAPELPQGDQTG